MTVELEYEVIGEGDPVLFVHGFPLTRELWRPTAAILRDRWQCILPDLRGHGASPPTPYVTMSDYADDLARLLDRLREWRPAVVVALSMGGYVAFDFFRRHRQRVRAMVLADTRANADAPDGKGKREELALAVLREGSQAAANAMLDKLFAPAADPALKEKWGRIMTSQPAEGVAAASRAMGERQDSTPTLSQIDCPTLFVVGESDSITPVPVHHDMHASVRGSQLEIISQSGHMPPVEQPERFASVLRRFLTNLPS